MKCPECGGTGCMPIQWTLMLDGICDRCDGTGLVNEFDGDMASLPDGWEEELREETLDYNLEQLGLK